MEEQQVDSIPNVADAQAALAGDKGEAIAELEQEIRQVLDQRSLHAGLGVTVVEVQELQDEGVPDGFLRGHGVAGIGLFSRLQNPGLVPGDAWSDFLPGSKDLEADWVKLKCGNYNTVTKKCGGGT